MITYISTDGRTVSVKQHDNGLYMAQIRDADGDVESATIVTTMAEVFIWEAEHGICYKP